MEEKRLYRRVALSCVATVVLDGDPSQSALVRDISLNGIGLYLRKALDPGAAVRVRLQFYNRSGSVIVERVEGRVAWDRSLGDIHLSAIALDEMIRPEAQPELFAYIVWADKQFKEF